MATPNESRCGLQRIPHFVPRTGPKRLLVECPHFDGRRADQGRVRPVRFLKAASQTAGADFRADGAAMAAVLQFGDRRAAFASGRSLLELDVHKQ